jgi:hypothetical protein
MGFWHDQNGPFLICSFPEAAIGEFTLWAAVSKGRRNTLIFLERWSV